MYSLPEKPAFISDNLNWVTQQPWLKDKKRVILALLFGSTSLAFGGMAFPYVRNALPFPFFGMNDDLPIGLPNNLNLCYLNAVLQAMASCRLLMKSFRRCLGNRRNRLLYLLVTVLEGLSCSFKYLKNSDLTDTILLAYKMLVEGLARTGKWTLGVQQDVHELYAFFIDLAEGNNRNQGTGTEISDSSRGGVPALVCSILGLPESAISPEKKLQQYTCFASVGFSPNSTLNRFNSSSPSVSSFCQLCVSQIFCSKCRYMGQLKLVPESCIILFPEKSRRMHTRKRSHRTKAAYKFTLDNLLKDEFGNAERLMGIHCPRCKAKALFVPENIINDPTPFVIDRSAIRHFAESECRNTCYSRRWFAFSPDTVQRVAQLSVAPPLVFYIQRAVWLPLKNIPPGDEDFVYHFSEGGMMIKCSDHVAFPATLDVSSYLTNGSTFRGMANLIKHDSNLAPNKKSTPNNYTLRAVIVHRGNTLQAGHYITYRSWKKEAMETEGTEDWVLTSDNNVYLVNFSSVQNCQAYMLFYEPEKALEEEQNSSHSVDEISVGNGDNDDWDSDRLQYFIRNIEKIASPSERIRVLMAAACGGCDVV
nr:ubiquitin specific peptidase 30 (C19 family) [Hymenolepis microstoma]